MLNSDFIPEKYAYLFGTLAFFLLWLFLFKKRKDLRREMIVVGVLAAILGTIGGYLFFTKDWWKPFSVTGTRVGLEDLFLGFFNGGIAAVIYKVVFKKKFSNRTYKNAKNKFWLLMAGFIGISLMFFFFYILKIHSFKAMMVGLIATLSVFYLRRPDLIFSSLMSGALMTLISFPVYFLVIQIYPGIVEKVWMVQNLSGIYFLGVPIEDFIWIFAVGAVIGPSYEFWHGYQLKNLS